MKIADICRTKQTLSFEIFPPKKDSDLQSIDKTLEILSDLKPDFISVTFGAGGGSNRNRTIELAKQIKNDYKIEPVVHLTSIHYTKAEIDRFASVMREEGIENVLALRGDRTDLIPEKDDFRHASDLVSYLREKYDFCILGACYPECHPESDSRISDIAALKKKVDAGAEVLLSQMFFDNEMFYDFVERTRIADIDVPVIPGIMPVTKAAQIRKMVSICHASFPRRFEKIIERYGDDSDALFDAGMSYALSQIIDLLSSDVSGIHLYTMNNPVIAGRICEGIKNIACVRA
ncbi:MAG: methylenetetrahydrofolate reductase [NAD(P)H] [Clostridiales bacterium]|nr:methylenetetrahydrofolate reductase [NAD(P)H] [Clostridiales bacterium]